MLDLCAPILPGHSGAGFVIGQTIDQIAAGIPGAKSLTYRQGFDLVNAISENTDVLHVDGFPPQRGSTIYFGPDTVRLDFSTKGRLFTIWLFNGYLGTYLGTPIGSPLSLVSSRETLLYDGGDEMYYRGDPKGEYLPGFAVC
jgi:hypothetical protein